MTRPAVLFDLDGTLVDSLGDIAGAMNDALVAVGRPPHPVEAYRRMVGDGLEMLARRALGPEHTALLADAIAVYRARYDARLDATTRPYDGVLALLEALVARDVPLGVLSNKPHAATLEVVRRLLPAPFVVVLGERPGVPRKPDPAGALEAARALGAAPADVLFAGDTATDLRTAVAAGMVPIGCLWGFRDEAELRAAGARHLLRAPGELLALATPRARA